MESSANNIATQRKISITEISAPRLLCPTTQGFGAAEGKEMTSLPDIANGLNKVRWHGDHKFSACCPAHVDRNPSFSASDIGGKILLKCFSGCCQESVIGALRDLGLWHTASRDQADRRKRCELKKDVRHHQQIILLGAASTTELSEADIAQMKESMAFLKEHAHG